VLLLVNYRPEYRHEWGNKRHFIQIGLKPLGPKNAEELLTARSKMRSNCSLKRLIMERTGGIRFLSRRWCRRYPTKALE
jgi:hypothetical protein